MSNGIAMVDWDQSMPAFERFVDEMIKDCDRNAKVITMPIQTYGGQTFLDMVGMIMAQVDCSQCNALCCRINPESELIDLMSEDVKAIKEAGHIVPSEVIKTPTGYGCKPPCPFLNKEINHCIVYMHRPFICAIYPVELGCAVQWTSGSKPTQALGLSARCPEARRIARASYIARWHLRKQYLKVMNNPQVRKADGK